jgi:hypothetical protein
MTHLFDSVGFFLYLCEMEPISVNYPDSSLSDLTNPCTEESMITFFRERMREMSLVHEKMYKLVEFERNRIKEGGDRGVHLGYRDNKK